MADESDAEVYRKCADELVRFATSLVGPADASDVVSTAVLQAVDARNWPEVINRRAYLYRCVLNEARSFRRSTLRRRTRERLFSAPELIEPQDVNPEVLPAMGRLSPRQRAVLFLSYWADLDSQAIAELLGISAGSVHRHLARARARLKRMLHD